MSQKRRWTDDEEKVIISEIEKTPHNLESAFRRASSKINRTPKAISIRWHERGLRERSNAVFVVYGRKTMNKNRKVVSTNTTDNTIKHTVGIWNRIKRLIFG